MPRPYRATCRYPGRPDGCLRRNQRGAERHPLSMAAGFTAKPPARNSDLATLDVSRAHSSAGERPLHTREVPGSIPGAPTKKPPETRGFLLPRYLQFVPYARLWKHFWKHLRGCSLRGAARPPAAAAPAARRRSGRSARRAARAWSGPPTAASRPREATPARRGCYAARAHSHLYTQAEAETQDGQDEQDQPDRGCELHDPASQKQHVIHRFSPSSSRVGKNPGGGQLTLGAPPREPPIGPSPRRSGSTPPPRLSHQAPSLSTRPPSLAGSGGRRSRRAASAPYRRGTRESALRSCCCIFAATSARAAATTALE